MDFILKRSVFVQCDQNELFQFFADAGNLEVLTPPWVNFQFLTSLPIKMKLGATVEYRIRLHMIPIRWESEITDWNPPDSFTDVQTKGPYKKWVHSHTFVPKENGTVMTDLVSYQVPGGRFINWAFVSKDLNRIFDYRREKILELFPS